jgi:hypothetical protein
MARLREFDFLPTKFSGTAGHDPLAHWLSYEDYATVQALDDANKIQKFKLSLTEEARLWIDGKAFATSAALKEAFISRFSGTPTREGALSAFKNAKLKPGESVEAFVSRLRRNATRVGYNDEVFVKDQFLSGLPDEVRIATVMSNTATLDDAVQSAQKYIDLKGTCAQVTFSMGDDSVTGLAEQLASALELRSTASKVHERVPTPHRQRSKSPTFVRYSRRDRDSRNNLSESPSRFHNKSERYARSPRRFERSRERMTRGTPRNSPRRYSRSPKGYESYGRSKSNSPQRRSGSIRRTNDRRGRSKSRDFRCYFCNGQGHYMADCKIRKDELNSILESNLKSVTNKENENL